MNGFCAQGLELNPPKKPKFRPQFSFFEGAGAPAGTKKRPESPLDKALRAAER